MFCQSGASSELPLECTLRLSDFRCLQGSETAHKLGVLVREE